MTLLDEMLSIANGGYTHVELTKFIEEQDNKIAVAKKLATDIIEFNKTHPLIIRSGYASNGYYKSSFINTNLPYGMEGYTIKLLGDDDSYNYYTLTYNYNSWGIGFGTKQLFPRCRILQSTDKEMVVEYSPNTFTKAKIDVINSKVNSTPYTNKSSIEIKSLIQKEVTLVLGFNNHDHCELSFLESQVHNMWRGNRYSYNSLNSNEFATIVKVLYPSVTTRYEGRQLGRAELSKAVDGLVPRDFGIKNLDTLMYVYARLLRQNNKFRVKGTGVTATIEFTIDGIVKFIKDCGGIIDGKIGVRKNFKTKEKKDGEESNSKPEETNP